MRLIDVETQQAFYIRPIMGWYYFNIGPISISITVKSQFCKVDPISVRCVKVYWDDDCPPAPDIVFISVRITDIMLISVPMSVSVYRYDINYQYCMIYYIYIWIESCCSSSTVFWGSCITWPHYRKRYLKRCLIAVCLTVLPLMIKFDTWNNGHM